VSRRSDRIKVVTHIVTAFDLSAKPERIVAVVAVMAREVLRLDEEPAAEWAAGEVAAIESELQAALAVIRANGGHPRFEFNQSSPDHLQGSSFVAPAERGTPVEGAKLRRLDRDQYAAFLANLTWREFEASCRGILRLLGSTAPVLTKESGDQGIDFYGEVSLEGRLENASELPGIDSRLSVWMVGQAKHYPRGKVSTPELRELVGSVQLARSGASADGGVALAGFRPRVCDPIVYLFFTTGQISRDGRRLLDESGVVGMDGEQLAIFLSDNKVGAPTGTFDASAAGAWIAECLTVVDAAA
jgi:hypothetical protein